MAFIEDISTKRVPTKLLQNVVQFLNAILEVVAQIPTDLDEVAANAFLLDYLSRKEAVALL